MNRIRQRIMEILGPGAERGGREGGGGGERAASLTGPSFILFSSGPSPIMACGGDGLRGRASRFLRG